jgi:hypothetical protein
VRQAFIVPGLEQALLPQVGLVSQSKFNSPQAQAVMRVSFPSLLSLRPGGLSPGSDFPLRNSVHSRRICLVLIRVSLRATRICAPRLLPLAVWRPL